MDSRVVQDRTVITNISLQNTGAKQQATHGTHGTIDPFGFDATGVDNPDEFRFDEEGNVILPGLVGPGAAPIKPLPGRKAEPPRGMTAAGMEELAEELGIAQHFSSSTDVR